MHVDVKRVWGTEQSLGGTLLGKFLVCDNLPLNDMCDCLPPK